MMRNRPLLVSIVILAASISLALDGTLDPTTEGLDKLTERRGDFETTLLHPDADLSAYDKLCFQSVALQFREKTRSQNRRDTGSRLKKRSKRSATPSSDDLAHFKQVVSRAVEDELKLSGDFQVVENAGPGTILLKAAVVDIVSTIPPKSNRKKDIDEPFVADGIIVFDLIDAESGSMIGRIGERRTCRNEKDVPESGDQEWLWSTIDDWVEHAAADLRQELERIRTEDLANHSESST